MAFQEPERSAVRDLTAASNPEDLALMVRLWQAGKLKDRTKPLKDIHHEGHFDFRRLF